MFTRETGDPFAKLNHLTRERLFLDEPCVVAEPGRGCRLKGEVGENALTAERFQNFGIEVLLHGHQVDRSSILLAPEHRLKDLALKLAVEVRGRERADDLVDG